VRCGSCGHDNASGKSLCDMCGERLAGSPGAPPKRATEIEAPAGPAPANPSTKRRTEYEPPSRPAEPVRAAPAAGGWSPPPGDPFARSARPPINPEDPWGNLPPRPPQAEPARPPAGATLTPPPPATASPWAAAPPPGGWNPAPTAPTPEPRPKSRTVIEHPGAGPSIQVRGALFEYRAPEDAGRIHPIRNGQNRLGRAPDRDIVIDGDPKISGEHGFILIAGDQATFVDNGSTNGSVVDGTRMRAGIAPLQSGSILVLGDVRLVFFLVPSTVLHGG
jgi:hypothetical protein